MKNAIIYKNQLTSEVGYSTYLLTELRIQCYQKINPSERTEKMSGNKHEHDHQHNTDGKTNAMVHNHTNTKAVLNRLSRASGHLNAVSKMVEQGRDCSEVLIQLAAVRSAINKTCEVILKEHLEHCVVESIRSGDTETMDELKRAIELLMK